MIRTVWWGSVRRSPAHATRDYRLRGFAIGGSTSHNHVPVMMAIRLVGIGHAGDLGGIRKGLLELGGNRGLRLWEGSWDAGQPLVGPEATELSWGDNVQNSHFSDPRRNRRSSRDVESIPINLSFLGHFRCRSARVPLWRWFRNNVWAVAVLGVSLTLYRSLIIVIP